jgi:cytochrome c-type biogenesis protein CcmF
MDVLGKTLIYIAAAAAAGSLVLYLARERFTGFARLSFRAATIAIVSSSALLLFLILTHRFEFLYVRNYSSTDLPLYYLIATLWGGQEGTLLLWILYTSLLGLILMRVSGRFERIGMSVVSLFILTILAILIKRSPFETAPFAVAEGAGLNPLLQDFWMTIHPPVMFLGFALSIFPFAIAIAGYVRGEYRKWTPQAWTWMLATWCTLATALVMGGYWAYKVLGWGGYWAWDPVENSSLIPWIFATGGLHSLIMLRKRNALARSAFLFAVLPFISILFGSFLTRSGVLGDFSVHSFLDLGINSLLVVLLLLFSVIGFGTLIWRFRRVNAEPAYTSMSTIGFFVSVGVLSLLIAGALVLIGMSTPLWTRLGGPPSNVTLRYYFMATMPVALILLVGLSVFPFMRWTKPTKPYIDPVASIPLAIAVFTGAAAFFGGIRDVLYIALLTLAALAAASNGYLIYDRFRSKRIIHGGYLAHVGLALLIVGAAVSSAYERKEQVGLPLGQPVERFGWTLTYQGVGHSPDDGKTPYNVLVERAGWETAYLCSPRQYELPDQGVMRKPAVKKFWNKDLYISPLGIEGDGQPGRVATLERGGTKNVNGFDVTFLGFEIDEGHGTGARVDCPAEIVGDMIIDTVIPAVVSTTEGLQEVPATFADGRYTMVVEQIDATYGAVDMRLIDHEDPNAATQVFWIELAEKPLINLFWIGTTLMVLGGLLALRKRAVIASQSTPHTPADRSAERAALTDSATPNSVVPPTRSPAQKQ